MALADEAEDLKKKLEQSEQRYINAKAIAESFKSKYDTKANTANNLRMTVSQHVLEKRALKAQFEEAMQLVFSSEEEIK